MATALDAERKAVEAELAEVKPAPVVTLHPGALKRYEEMICRLQQAVAAGVTAGNIEYFEALRDLVETVTVRPGSEPGRVEVTIEGRLAALLGVEAFPNGRRGVCGTLVAGAEPPLFNSINDLAESGTRTPPIVSQGLFSRRSHRPRDHGMR
jgi:hypothetical protein